MGAQDRGLRPGVQALTLPHPLGRQEWSNQLVLVLSLPVIAPVWTTKGHARMVVCKIRFMDERLALLGAQYPHPVGWPASHLIKLPDDDQCNGFDLEYIRSLGDAFAKYRIVETGYEPL